MMKYLLVLSMTLLTACGFHLRGIMPLPTAFNQVAIVNHQVDHHLQMELEKRLHQHHIQVIENPALAHYLIILEKEKLSEQLTNVAASTAPRQYQLVYQVQFQLLDKGGKPLVPLQTITTQLEAIINNNRILGSNFEAHTIENDLKQHAAQQIVDRISARLSP